MNYIYLWDFFKLEIQSYSIVDEGFYAQNLIFFYSFKSNCTNLHLETTR